MTRLFFAATLAFAACAISSSSAQAQGLNSGYGFGLGANYSGVFSGLNNGFYNNGFRNDQPPYFAQYPPVYYSHIVARPYGISPYAAPPGIVPVEMNYADSSTVERIVNPHYSSDEPTVMIERILETTPSVPEAPAVPPVPMVNEAPAKVAPPTEINTKPAVDDNVEKMILDEDAKATKARSNTRRKKKDN